MLMRSHTAVRHRHCSRIEQLERAVVASDENLEEQNDDARKRADTAILSKVQARVDREMEDLDNDPNGEPAVYIQAWTDKQFQAEALIHDMARCSYNEFPGFKGAIVIVQQPLAGAGKVCMHVFFEYQTSEHLKTWMGSDRRKMFMTLGSAIFSNNPHNFDGHILAVHDCAIGSLFATGAKMYQQHLAEIASGNDDQPLEWHPPTWRMYLAMNVAFTIVGYPVGDLWLMAPGGPLSRIQKSDGSPLELWEKLCLNVIILVTIVVYVGVPVVIYYTAHWLFVPWRKSQNRFIAVLQEGFPCCLADGPPPPLPEEDPEDANLAAV